MTGRREDQIETVVWGTGNVGRAAIRAVAANPDLVLRGVLTSSPDKVGREAGEVADVGRRVVREGLHGRLKTLSTPHGEHPTLEHGDPGVDRTPGSDPGHD